jgi:hypothetical protein
VIGSLQVPYIYEDRISQEGFNDTLRKAMNRSPKAYDKMCRQGMNHVKKNYSFENYQKKWVETMDEIVEKHGSWETRKNYDRWHLLEVA